MYTKTVIVFIWPFLPPFSALIKVQWTGFLGST